MRVLCFGSYDPEAPRNRVLLKGLAQNGVEVDHCNASSPDYPRKYLEIASRFADAADVVLVCNPGHEFVPLAKLLVRRRTPIVLDAMWSLYDTFVRDRGEVRRGAPKSMWFWALDKVSCTLADAVLLDTSAHIEYFHRAFRVATAKFWRIAVGSDDDVFRPISATPEGKGLVVAFVGTFIPLHGLSYVVQAAKILEGDPDIHFRLLGRGQTYEEVVRLARRLDVRNIEFLEPRPYGELPEFLASADVCLGIFGGTDKAMRVVPTKVFDIAAMAKPILTGRSPAIAEAGFVNRANALLVPMADAKAIAEAVQELRSDEGLRRRIAAAGHELFRENFTPRRIGASLKAVLESAVEAS